MGKELSRPYETGMMVRCSPAAKGAGYFHDAPTGLDVKGKEFKQTLQVLGSTTYLERGLIAAPPRSLGCARDFGCGLALRSRPLSTLLYGSR